MAAPRYRIKFVAEGREERTPKDPKQGGFELHTIPVGTVRDVTAASLNFWLQRGCIELLGRTPRDPDPFAVALEGIPRQPVVDLSVPAPVDAPDVAALPPQFVGKGKFRAALEAAIEVDDLEAMKPIFAGITFAAVQDMLTDAESDTIMIIDALLQDANSSEPMAGNLADVKDAIKAALYAMLPPSKRKLK